MRIYCLCNGDNEENRLVNPENEGTTSESSSHALFVLDTFPGVVIDRRMEFVKSGVPQYIENPKGSSLLYKHYPNTDVYRCPDCGATVVHEGGV